MLKAKESSSNYERFASQYGDDAYELEAVEPVELETILEDAIEGVIDTDLFNEEVDLEKEDAAKLDVIRQQAHKFFGSFSAN